MLRLVCLLALATLARAAEPKDCEVLVTHAAGPFIDYGSGTVVRSGQGVSWVLTNYHVAPSDATITVTHRGHKYPARRIGYDPGLDLCGLEIAAELPAADIATSPAQPGEALHQLGHAGGNASPVRKEGKYLETNGRRAMAGGGEVLRTSIDAQSGDSGCGVFNANGQLVAVCWGRTTGGPGQSCVKLEDIRKFLHLEP